MNNFYKAVMDTVYDEKVRLGSFRELCEPLGLPITTVQKWFKETNGDKPRSPNFIDVSKIMDYLGYTVCREADLLAMRANAEASNMQYDRIRKIARATDDDNGELLEKYRELMAENQRLQIENATLKGQNDILKELVMVPMCKKPAI